MATTTLAVKDATSTSKSLSAVQDASNSSAIVTFHGIADGSGSNKLAVSSGGVLGSFLVDSSGTNKAAVSAGGVQSSFVVDSSGTNKLAVSSGGIIGAFVYDTAGTNKLAVDASGYVTANLSQASAAAAMADGFANPTIGKLGTCALHFNGTTWDRSRGNYDTAALITATAATTNQASSDQTNYNWRGVKVVVDVTNIGTATGLTATIQGKDAASGKYYTLLAGAAITTNSTNVYSVYPGGPVTTNVSANSQLPRVWRVIVTVADSNEATYTVGASLTV